MVTRWGADGDLFLREQIDAADLGAAMTFVDELSFDAIDPLAVPGQAILEWARVTHDGDWEAAARLLSPDYVATTDQFLYGDRPATGGQLLAWFATEADAEHTRVHIATELHATSTTGILTTEVDHFVDGDGFAFESWQVSEITVHDGLITSATARDLHKLPEMLDEFDRRSNEQGSLVAYLSEVARALRWSRSSSDEPYALRRMRRRRCCRCTRRCG